MPNKLTNKIQLKNNEIENSKTGNIKALKYLCITVSSIPLSGPATCQRDNKFNKIKLNTQQKC